MAKRAPTSSKKALPKRKNLRQRRPTSPAFPLAKTIKITQLSGVIFSHRPLWNGLEVIGTLLIQLGLLMIHIGTAVNTAAWSLIETAGITGHFLFRNIFKAFRVSATHVKAVGKWLSTPRWSLAPIVALAHSAMSQIRLPKVSKLPKLPKLPVMAVPSFKAPVVNLPALKLPAFKLPSINVPSLKVTFPQLPKLPQLKKAVALKKNKPISEKVIYSRPRLRSYPWRTTLSMGLTIAIITCAFSVYTFVFKGLPSPLELRNRHQPLTTRILDRNGQVLFRVYEDENRSLVPLSQVPPHMIQATIAIEDQHFYQHHGFDVMGILRASIANFKGESIQGGSTLTQQLVKNTLLSPEKTLQRKLREVVLSILVEGTYSKDEILEMYLNQIAYGGSTYGIEAAAHRYFNKSASDLTLAESSLLAALPAAPSVYTPFASPELAAQRQAKVLRRMVEDGYITQAEADAAQQEKLSFRTNTIDIQAPHFVMYVKKLLAEKYGEEAVNQGGLEVRTTLDLDLQKSTQEAVTTEVESLARLRVSNGAALVTNPKTGEVLAMVGSTNYFDFEHDGQVNVTIRPRQPGSSIKPLTYAMAMERGMNPSSTIDDVPTTFAIPGSKPYSPQNYDGRFHGKVSLRTALGSSFNIPAVKMASMVGVNNIIDKGQSMGISTWQDRQRFGLSLTLGGGEVLMTDMAELYSTFANNGYTMDNNPILEVRDSTGKVLYRNTCALDNQECARRKTLDTRVAYQITDILSDNAARTPAFGAHSVLTIPNQQVAVKTGTTNNLHDNWAIGYTTDRLVSVWVGNNDNAPMAYVVSGVTGASPIWNKIMRSLLDDQHPHAFAAPEGLIKVAICTRTGTLPCKSCPNVKEELFVPGTEPKAACTPKMFYTPRPKSTSTPKPSGTPQAQQRGQILTGITTTR